MVQVKLSETYDLSTQIDKMGVIGVHTPSTKQIKEVWGSMYKCHSHYRLVKCDVSMACASMLPADPLQIGVEEGTIAPQDMFNPILYTAVSNEGFNRVIQRIYEANSVSALDSTLGTLSRYDYTSADVSTTSTTRTPFELYYALLADSHQFRKAMPQAGLTIKGLYPIVYSVVATYGNGWTNEAGDNSGSVGITASQLNQIPKDVTGYTTAGKVMRGPAMRMPAIPTIAGYTASTTSAVTPTEAGFPSTYVACIIVPPGKLNKFYFRMRVTWTIEFMGIRSDLQSDSLYNIAAAGRALYGTDYAEQSKMMTTTDETVDVRDAELEHIMTST